MPAIRVVPVTVDFLSAWQRALRGEIGAERNDRRGGVYDLVGGPSALQWARQAARDRDEFRQCYASTATGSALDRIVLRRYGVSRVADAYGTGHAVLARPTSGGGAGTLYAGTRIEATGRQTFPAVYSISEDTDVGASDLSAEVPIVATRAGPGVALDVSSGLRLTDAVYDATFAPASLRCSDGVDAERDDAYLARGRAAKADRRVGTQTAIRRACEAAGAVYVVVLGPDTFGEDDDFGVTNAYVADSGFSSPESLIDACYVALESVRILGCDTQVLGMVATSVSLSVAVSLWDRPGRFDLTLLQSLIVAALVAEFNSRPDFWIFTLEGLQGAAAAAISPAASGVSIVSTPSAPTPGFVSTLPRYVLAGGGVSVVFSGP